MKQLVVSSVASLSALLLSTVSSDVSAQGRSRSPSASAPQTLPATLDVCLKGAILKPHRANGDPWQPLGKKETPELAGKVGKAVKALLVLGSVPTGTAAVAAITTELFAPSVLNSLSKPRVYGTFEMTPDGAWDHKVALNVASAQSPVNDFQPAFDVCFKDISYKSDALFRVHLFNKHSVFQDDDIASVQVTAPQIAAIYKAADVHHVVVAGQDRGQLLTLSLSVSKGVSSAK